MCLCCNSVKFLLSHGLGKLSLQWKVPFDQIFTQLLNDMYQLSTLCYDLDKDRPIIVDNLRLAGESLIVR